MEDLADLDLNKEELLLREGKLLEPTANVQADAYQYEVGILPVTVSDINNLQGSVEKVMLVFLNSTIKKVNILLMHM